ncbi:MAG: sigma-70 family RNA polymerase sigma factor [Phycisphaeraceae bacterium]
MNDEADKPLEELSHEQVVGRYRDGDEQAFETLVRRFRQELFHFLLRFVNNRAAAEDLFQETFLQVHISIDTFDITRNFKPWLFTIAANKARDYLRRNSRQQAAPLSALVDASQDNGRTFIDLLEADLPMPMEDLEKQETRELVQEVIDALPDHLREVLLLAYFNHFAYKEIAAMLSIPLGTVKSRLHAAVGTFSELWKSRYEAKKNGAKGDQGGEGQG